MLKKSLVILIFALGLTVGFSVSAASGTCPTDNGAGVGCNIGIGEYYCLGSCRTGQTQCPTWTGTVCATGLSCPANCTAADSCGYCNACASGYTLCGSYPSQTCTANTPVPANCSSYSQCTAVCSACAQGYELVSGACIGATLKLGSDSVGALNHIFQSTSPSLYVLSSGSVGIGTSTPAAGLEVISASGNSSFLAGLKRIGNVDIPFDITDAATKGYVDSTVSAATSSITLWGGTTVGNIWNLNGGSVGIGTTNPGGKLNIEDIKRTDVDTGTIILQAPATAIGDKLGITFAQTDVFSRARAGIYSISERADGYGSSLGFFARSAADVTALGNADEKMRITSGGNIGIGTTTPAYKFVIDAGNTANPTAEFRSSNTTYGPQFVLNATPGGLGGEYRLVSRGGANAFSIWSAGSGGYAFNMLPNGFVGIGTTSPAAKLEVVSASGNSSILAGLKRISNVDIPFDITDAATKGYVDSYVAAATSSITLWGGTIGGNIWSLNSSNVGIGTTSPGAKLDLAGNALISGGSAWSLGSIAGVGTYIKGLVSGYSITDDFAWIKSMHNNTAFKGLRIGANDFSVWTGGGTLAQRLTIDASGNIGIGFSATAIAPNAPLSFGGRLSPVAISGGAARTNADILFYDLSAANWSGMGADSSGNFWLKTGTGATNYYLVMTAGGFVGIGTTTPAARLDIAGSNSGVLRFSNTSIGSSNWEFRPYIVGVSNGGFSIRDITNSSERIVISSTGNVGIGTTTPVAALEVASASGNSNILAGLKRISNVDLPFDVTDAATKGYVDSTIDAATSSLTLWGGTTGGNIWSLNSGNVGIGTTTPVAKLDVSGGSIRVIGNTSPYPTIGEGLELIYDTDGETSGLGMVQAYDRNGGGFMPLYVRGSKVILGNGNVGIGTTTPATLLNTSLTDSAVTQLLMTRLGTLTGATAFDFVNGWSRLGTQKDFRILTGMNINGNMVSATERFVILAANGYIGMGTTSPTAALEVASASGNSNILAGLKRISNVDLPFDVTDATTKGYVDSLISTATGSITTLWGGTTGGNIWSLNSGNVGIGTTSPTKKLEIAGGTWAKGATDGALENILFLGKFSGSNTPLVTIKTTDASTFLMDTYMGRWISNFRWTMDSQNGEIITASLTGHYTNGGAFNLYGDQADNTIKVHLASEGNSYLNGSGNVGIGTTNPLGRLTIYDTNSNPPLLRLGYDSTHDYIISRSNTTGYLTFTGVQSSYTGYNFSTANATNAFVIANNGSVGIGTSTPAAKLEVISASGNSNILAGLKRISNVDLPFDITDAATKGYVDSLVSTATSSITLWGGTTGGNIWNLNSGNVGIGEAAPTYRLDVKGTTTDSGIRSAMGFDIYKVPDPIVIPTGVVSSGGSVNTGTHYYRLTYATEFGETSSIGSAVITTTAGNNTVTLTIPISTDPRVTSRKLYRSKAGASNGQEYYLATVNNNTDTTYIDTVADSTLTGSAGVAIYRANTTTNYISLNGTRAMVLDEKLVTFGALAGASITTGGYTTAIGTGALRFDTSGGSNTAVGYTALGTNATAHHSTAVGYATLGSNTGGQNTAVGSRAMLSNNIGVYNSVLGYTSLGTNTTGNYNVALGSLAGYYIEDGASGNTTGDYNVFIGADSRAKTNNDQNQIVIGYGAIGNGSDTATIGNDNILRTILKGSIGIGTTTPAAKLEVISASGNSNILAGLKRISNVDLPFDIADAATKGYVDSTVNAATSSLTAIAVFSASTAATYTGAQSGYTGGNALCNAASTGSHVCTTEEILYTVNSGQGAAIPFNSTLWISNGPPAYTANANDCQGWTSAAAADYGTVWIKLATGDGFGGLNRCNSTYKFACCK